MKKVLFFVSFLSLISLTACNFGIPKSISVKTKADYKFCIVKTDMNLDKFLSIDSLLNSGSSSTSGMNLYSYKPAGDKNNADKKQFLVEMPFQKIPLDFSAYLNNMNFTQEAFDVAFSFDTPKSLNQKVEKALDVETIRTAIGAAVNFSGDASESVGLSFDIEGGGSFESVVYSKGEIIVQSNQPDGVEVSLITLNQTLKSSFNNKIAVFTLPQGTAFGATGTEINFGSGYAAAKFNGAIDPDKSTVSKVTGFTLASKKTDIPSQNLNLSLGDSLKSITIGEGKITSKLTVPSDWSGVVSEVTGDFTGALDVSLDASGITSLNNKTIDCSKQLSFAGELSIAFDHATLVFGNQIPAYSIEFDVTKLSDVTVDIGEVTLSKKVNIDLPKEAQQMIKEIVWKDSGVSVTLTKFTLPEGNNLNLDLVKSTFFSIQEENVTLELNKEEKFYCPSTPSPYKTTDPKTVDFEVALSGLGYSEANHTITLKNLELNKNYGLNLSIKPTIDWYSVKIDTSALSGAGKQEGEIHSNINLSALLSSVDLMLYGEKEGQPGVPNDKLSSKLMFKKLPLYLYCNIPECLGDVYFTGQVEAYIQDGTDAHNTVSSTPVKIVDGKLDCSEEFVLKQNEAKEVTSNVSAIKNVTDLVPLLKDEGYVSVDYSLSMESSGAELTIVNEKYATSSDLTFGKNDSKSIEITAYLPVVLDFTVTPEDGKDNICIDVLSIAKMDKNEDLLGRKEKPEQSELMEKLKAIKSVDLIYAPSKVPFGYSKEKPIKVTVDLLKTDPDTGIKTSIFESDGGAKELSFEGGSVSLTPSDIMETYPLTADVQLVIPKGSFYIPATMDFATSLAVNIHTDGSIELMSEAE